jgi:hypothetical protein
MANWATPTLPGLVPNAPMMSLDPSQQNPLVAPNPSASLFDPARAGVPDFSMSLTNTTTPNSWMPDWLKGAVGTKEAPGWGGMAVGAAGSLASLFMGMKQYGLAKETLAQNKAQFDQQYTAQKQLTNTQLEDRQRARVASNPGAYQGVAGYMSQYGIK